MLAWAGVVAFMKILDELLEEQLYLGHVKTSCAYLPGKEASFLFLEGQSVGSMYRMLLDKGYRRHGRNLYRPDCLSCHECSIIRLSVEAFQASNSQRRVWRKGQGIFRHECGQPQFSLERLKLYQTYLQSQHPSTSSSEALPTQMEYSQFLVDSFLGEGTIEMCLFAENRLVGLGILDCVGNALSAVYFMYHPDYRRYSLGKYAILLNIELARQWELSYYYPGYYIKDCTTMNYKAQFRPHEIKKIN